MMYQLVVPEIVGSWEAPNGLVYEAGTHFIDDEATVNAARDFSVIGVGVRRVHEEEMKSRKRARKRKKKNVPEDDS